MFVASLKCFDFWFSGILVALLSSLNSEYYKKFRYKLISKVEIRGCSNIFERISVGPSAVS